MRRFDALASDAIPSHTLFLEASAGTGKTFAIENLVTRKVLEGITIDEILVVTFTKAATRELKTRIANALAQAYDHLQTSQSIPYLDAIEDKEKAGRILMRANQNIELIHIYTIHSFCFRMLKQFALEASLPILDEVEDEEPFDLKSLILDTLRSTTSKEIPSTQFKLLLRYHQNDLSKLLASFERQIEIDTKVQPVASFDQLLAQFQQELESIEQIDKEKLMQDFTSMFASHQKCLDRQKQLHPPFERQLHTWMTWLYTKKVHQSEFEAMLFEKVFFFEYFTEEYRKKSVKEAPPLIYETLFQHIQTTLLPLLKEAKSPHHITLYLLGLFQPQIQAEIEKNPTAHPDMLLKKMDEALFNPLFLKQVQGQFRVAIIDEFQDTDPIQWGLLERIFLNDAIDLFAVVGDPKQSIYSFRAADLMVYEQAKAKMGSYHVLDTNYRSDPSLMEALNRLFNHEALFTFTESGLSLEYTPVRAGVKIEQKGEVKLCYTQAKGQKKGMWPPSYVEEEVFFPHLCASILKHYEKGIELNKMAILVKDRYQAKRVQHYLLQCAIPTLSLRATSLAKTQSYRFLILFLSALENPYSPSALKGVMAHRFFHLASEELLDEAVQIRWQRRFIEMAHLIQEKGLSSAWNRFLEYDESAFYKGVIQGKNSSDYCDFETLIEQLLAIESEEGRALSGLMRYLVALKESDPDVDPKAKRRLSKSLKGVQIMTTHMSKGLEFDIVFALGTASRTPQNAPLIAIDKHLQIYDENEKKVIDKMRKLDEEKLRQLYVAWTRAKLHLYSYCAFSEEAMPLRYGEASAIELYLAKRNQSQQAYEEVYKRVKQLKTIEEGVELFANKQQKKLDIFEKKGSIQKAPQLSIEQTPYRITSFSGLTQDLEVRHQVEVSEESSIQNLPAGPTVGVVIHAIFEAIFDQNLFNPYSKEAIEALVERLIALTPLENDQTLVVDLVERVLHAPLVDGVRCVDLARSKVIEEAEFIFKEEEHFYLKGFVDLIFEWEGKVYLLDWKTNRLDHYSQEALQEAIKLHRYDLQASIYAKALKKRLELHHDGQFGGMIYFFLRGVEKGEGVYTFHPEERLCLN